MCGFLVTTDVRAPFTHVQMRGLQRRGPDGLGFYVDQRVRIAHARLAIVGLDDNGVEPIENERYVLAFNGEIYNWQELRYALGLNKTMPTDAHVLLEMWTAAGQECLEDLHGFWAFALYDKQSGEVVLCRDQVGIKPLYYTVDGPLKAASTIAALDHHGELDYAAISEYVRYQFTFGDKTFFRGVKKVLPGHIVRVLPGRGLADGEQTRDFVHVDDVVAMVRVALDRPSSYGPAIVNVCSGVGTTINAACALLGAKQNRTGRKREGDMRDCRGENKRMIHMLQRPPHPFTPKDVLR